MCVPLLLLHTASGFAVRAAAGRSAAAPLRAVAAQASEYQSLLGDAKAALIDACTVADMGRIAEFRPSVLEAIEQIEPLNPTPKPLEAPDLLTGCWRLIYTTSDSILGTTRPRPFRPRYKRILQSIDARQLAAKNEEWVLLGLLKNMVRARLTPRDDGRTVDVQFLRFGIGWLRIPAPAAAKGVLETTYLDDTLRVSRGDKGNLFVLVREGGFGLRV